MSFLQIYQRVGQQSEQQSCMWLVQPRKQTQLEVSLGQTTVSDIETKLYATHGRKH